MDENYQFTYGKVSARKMFDGVKSLRLIGQHKICKIALEWFNHLHFSVFAITVHYGADFVRCVVLYGEFLNGQYVA